MRREKNSARTEFLYGEAMTPDLDWDFRVARIQERIDELASITDEPGGITRTFLSPGMLQANQMVAKWMREAGLNTTEDAVGNILGELPGDPQNPLFVLGSHLDSVRNAGRFDGILGVVLAIEAVDLLRTGRVNLPFSLAVVGFSDEEGVRFQNAYLGSKAFCGLITPRDLAMHDQDGLTLRQVLERWKEGRFVMPKARYTPERVAGFLEVHIEQGPVLERENLALGVVSAIAGQSRIRLAWTGKASHAGTTPLSLRQDALVGAAAFILAVQEAAAKFGDLVATVGQIAVEPNVSNVVPSRAVHSLDVRHPDDSVRNQACAWLERRAREIARERQLQFEWETLQVTNAKKCDATVSRRLIDAMESVTGSTRQLPSGAGHDAAILSRLFPVAMLLVRCRHGLSHHPDEFVAPTDISAALKVTVEFLTSWEL
jgi:allantoate deiminase